MKQITLRGKILKLPAFFPDATYGKIKGLSSKDLIKTGTKGVVVNTYHLLKNNLVPEIKKKGGIHKFMRINLSVISDSGGFQVFSLIHRTGNGKITENEIEFTLDKKNIIMTPESCIQTQIEIGADIIMCLDDCRHADDEQKESVARTIRWAKRCKEEYLRLTSMMKEKDKPLLFGIVQGGENKKLRKKCASELVKIGFDGYAYGGWPMKNGKLLSGILRYVSDLLPDDKIKYAMGVGKPRDIIVCKKMGYNLFDCVLPTRDARHKRIFQGLEEINIRKKYFFSKLKIEGKSVRQVHELFKNNKDEAIRLCTMHNLREYSRLMEKI